MQRSDPKIALKILDVEARQAERRLQTGLIGRLFGAAQDKPGNIAGTAIVVSLLILLCLFLVSYFVPNSNETPVGELMALFGSIVTLALGYLFGKGS